MLTSVFDYFITRLCHNNKLIRRLVLKKFFIAITILLSLVLDFKQQVYTVQ